MKESEIFVKMLASILIVLLIMAGLMTVLGAEFFAAALISLTGFIVFGVAGSVFWFLANYLLNRIARYRSYFIFISAMVASLLSGFCLELASSGILISKGKVALASQLFVMPIAILSALIYFIFFQVKPKDL